MKKLITYLLFIFAFSSALSAQKITIFAASDLRFALDEVKEKFLEQNQKSEVEMIYGSSGKGMHQIENGAPYHIYFSANMAFVKKLYAQGDIITKPKLYAVGRIVLWSKHENFKPSLGFENLKEAWVHKIAIANPSHAPYGEKAKQALQKAGIYDVVRKKLVLGENISQTAGFISSEAADIGVIALSLALAPTISGTQNREYYLINSALHDPLIQGYGITKVGSSVALAQKFYDFMQTEEVDEIMKKYGFGVK